MQKTRVRSVLSALDWLSFAVVALLALWFQNWWLGALALALGWLAWYNPGQRIMDGFWRKARASLRH